MAVGRSIFMVVFTPLTSYALPLSLLLKILFSKKIELLVSKLKNIHISCLQCRLYFATWQTLCQWRFLWFISTDNYLSLSSQRMTFLKRKQNEKLRLENSSRPVRTILHKRAELSLRTDADRHGLNERN